MTSRSEPDLLSASTEAVAGSYTHCLNLARSHYENFPVASVLIPAPLRNAVAAVYAFARSADDMADEGDLPAQERLARLTHYRRMLQQIRDHRHVDDPVLIAVADASRRHQLPLQLFDDLLTAFSLDVTKKRYESFSDVLFYCRHSANPVGRLLLYIFNAADADNLKDADAICTALQLINFLQDLEQDYQENGRIYIPRNDMARFGVTEDHFARCVTDRAMRDLITAQIMRSRAIMLSGAPLAWRLPGRFGVEIRATVFGGLRILDKLMSAKQDVFTRPRLRTTDKLFMLTSALLAKCPDT